MSWWGLWLVIIGWIIISLLLDCLLLIIAIGSTTDRLAVQTAAESGLNGTVKSGNYGEATVVRTELASWLIKTDQTVVVKNWNLIIPKRCWYALTETVVVRCIMSSFEIVKTFINRNIYVKLWLGWSRSSQPNVTNELVFQSMFPQHFEKVTLLPMLCLENLKKSQAQDWNVTNVDSQLNMMDIQH